MPNRVRPNVELRLYDEGQGDPYITDPGYSWRDDLSQTTQYGDPGAGLYNSQALQLVDGMLIPRARFQPKDNLTAHWVVLTETWHTELPSPTYWSVTTTPTSGLFTGPEEYGNINSKLMKRISSSLPLRHESAYVVPAGCALGMMFGSSSTYYDNWHLGSTTNGTYTEYWTEPPYVKWLLGMDGTGPEWTLAWQSEQSGQAGQGWLLDHRTNPAGVAVMAIPEFFAGDASNPGWIVRVEDGALLVSANRGATYSVYRAPDGTACTLRGGRQQLHTNLVNPLDFTHAQIVLPTATYRSRQMNTGKVRVAPSVTLSGVKSTPYSTSVTLTDAGTPASGIAQYTATLTPETVSGVYWSYYRGPSLRSVQYTILPTVSTPSGPYAVIPNSELLELSISKPDDIATSSLRLRLQRTIGSTWSYMGRYRKLVARLGWYQDDGTTTDWRTVYTGYLTRYRQGREAFGQQSLELEFGNISHWLRTYLWLPEQEVALGGRTVGEAGDLILQWAGIPVNGSYRSWATICNTLQLPAGAASNPHELTRAGESRWTTLERIMATAGCRMAVSDDGVISSVLDTHYTGTTHNYYCGATADVDQLFQALDEEVDYGDTGTRAYAIGEGENRERVWAYAADAYAETQTGSGRFAPWPLPRVDSYSTSITPALLAVRAGRAATDWFGLRKILNQGVQMNPAVGRLDRVRIYGATVLGIADGTYAVVRSLGHEYTVDPDTGESRWETRALLKL